MTRMIPVVLALTLIAVAPVVAEEQSVAPSWTTKVELGRPVFVTLASGDRVEGVAGSVTPDSLVVSTPAGIRTIAMADIQKVQRRDSLWTGPVIGAVSGAALVFGITSADGFCRDYYGGTIPASGDETCNEAKAPMRVTGAVIGALIGWGTDALVKGRSTVFDRSRAPQVSVTAGPRSVSARASISW